MYRQCLTNRCRPNPGKTKNTLYENLKIKTLSAEQIRCDPVRSICGNCYCRPTLNQITAMKTQQLSSKELAAKRIGALINLVIAIAGAVFCVTGVIMFANHTL